MNSFATIAKLLFSVSVAVAIIVVVVVVAVAIVAVIGSCCCYNFCCCCCYCCCCNSRCYCCCCCCCCCNFCCRFFCDCCRNWCYSCCCNIKLKIPFLSKKNRAGAKTSSGIARSTGSSTTALRGTPAAALFRTRRIAARSCSRSGPSSPHRGLASTQRQSRTRHIHTLGARSKRGSSLTKKHHQVWETFLKWLLNSSVFFFIFFFKSSSWTTRAATR